jgi:hypothetical protein
MLLGAKADSEGAAGSDHSRSRLTQPDTKSEADRHGKNKDGVGAKGLGFPIEDVAIGEETGGGDGGGGGHSLKRLFLKHKPTQLPRSGNVDRIQGRRPEFPVKIGEINEPYAALLEESRTQA